MSETSSRKKKQGDFPDKGNISDEQCRKISVPRGKKFLSEPEPVSGLSLRLREAVFLSLLLASLLLFLSLLTYSSTDPGWNYVGYKGGIDNSIGRFGAWTADYLYFLFGFFAWVIPVVMLAEAIGLFRRRYVRWKRPKSVLILKGCGLVTLLITGATLAHLHLGDRVDLLTAGAGGILGQLVGGVTVPVLNVVGSTLVYFALLIVGITLLTQHSWFVFFDLIARKVKAFVLWCRTRFTKRVRTLVGWVQYKLDEWRERRQREKHLPDALDRQQEPDSKTSVLKDRVEPVLVLPAPEKTSHDVIASVTGEGATSESVSGELPTVNLLDVAQDQGLGASEEDLAATSRLLEAKLQDFGVTVEVTGVHPGPVITRYEIQPAPGVKASRISGLARDLARSLAVVSVRVVEVIPGKSVMGIEIPNDDREVVYFSEVLASSVYEQADSPLSLALGHDISGQPVVVNLAKMPHLLVAGTTGSGKSVGVNGMLLSMLFKSSPDDVRLIMIDPKMLELSVYDGIPHLLSPVVTDMKEAANALRWCVAEMERRYKLMAALGVRNISGYNHKVSEAAASGSPLRDPFYETLTLGDLAPELETLPFIVVVVDEFADMMMIVGKKVEELIARIAQKARAAGIHLILATQRPSVDVITGLIKANIPTRISYQVSSKIDSRTIIDQGGAEQLLGHGDMLYLPPGTSVPVRVHGAFVSDDEVHRVVSDWKKRGQPDYIDIDDMLSGSDAGSEGSAFSGGLDDDSEKDALYDEAIAFVTESRRASISSVQRKLKIGYNRAARMIEAMEQAGVVSPAGHNGNREVIAPPPVQD